MKRSLGAALSVALCACGRSSTGVDAHIGSVGTPAALVSPTPAPATEDPHPERLKLLALNDFHGQLSPKSVSGRPAGGAAVIAAYLKAASAGIEDRTFIVHAGDLVGASPLNSSLLEDEPAIMFLNTLANGACTYGRTDEACNVVGTAGNHEFDEGAAELMRLVGGGNSAKGPFLENPWRGARFPYVSANVIDDRTHQPIFPPYVIRKAGGVSVAFIGAVLRAAPSILPAAGIAGLTFGDEADAINSYIPEIHARGVHAIVILIHQGLTQAGYAGRTNVNAPAPTGELLSIIERLDDDIDVVVSGHTHQFTNALVANAHRVPILVTQAFSASTAFADIDLVVDPKSDDVVSKSARIVTTYLDTGPGLVPDAAVARLVAQTDAVARPIGETVVGASAATIWRAPNAAGESALGDLLADAQKSALHAHFALVNPGGIRDDLGAGPVTYADLFAIQPFRNVIVKIPLTGQQIYDLLNAQWGPSQPEGGRVLQVSGLRYTWNSSVPAGGPRVVDVRDGAGAPISRTRTYDVAVNDYLLGGGDGFTVFTHGSGVIRGDVDVDALAAYVKTLPRPFSAPGNNRITRR